ncbi:hypothetical protein DESC_870040 [Desulfosarcina cetonica]|nr:hypothetical protein DESC_870040 [Desulfosarcina cetonica]
MRLFLDAHGHLVEDGKHQCANGIDAQGDTDFRHGRGILIDLVHGVGHEPPGNHSQALVDPGSQDDDHAGKHQRGFVLAGRRGHREHDTGGHQNHGRPHPGHQRTVAVQSGKKVLDVRGVAGNIAVKSHKNLTQKEEDVDANCIGNGFCQALDLLLTRIEVGKTADKQAEQDQQGRAGGKGRSEKPGSQNGGQPEVTSGKTAVQISRNRMNAHGPGDGDVNQRFQPTLVVDTVALGFQHVPADHQVEEQVAVEHDGIIKENAVGCRVNQHVEGAHGLPEVDQDEEQAHDDGGNRQKLTQNRDLAIGFVIMQVVRQHHHHASGGHTDQVGEVGNVKSPRDVATHAGDTETELELHHVEAETGSDDTQKDDHPSPVPFISFYG